MPIGRLVNYFDDRGYGFLSRESERGPDVFVHGQAFKHARFEPRRGMVLTYEIAERNGRLEARNIEEMGARRDDSDD